MKDQYLTLLVLMLALVGTAGCIETFIGESTEYKPHVALNPSPAPQTGDFNFTGEIGIYGAGDACARDVRVILYDDNLTKIEEHSVGDLCLHNTSTKPLNITTSTQPSYIVIRSPSLYGDDPPARAVGMARNTTRAVYDKYILADPDQIRPGETDSETQSNRIHATALQHPGTASMSQTTNLLTSNPLHYLQAAENNPLLPYIGTCAV